MKEQTSTVVIAIDGEDELRLLQTIANDTGAAVTTVPVRDGGVSVVLVAGALIAVVKTLERCIERRAEARRGGQVIELQGGRVLVRRDLDLRPELVVIHGPDGALTVQALDDSVELRTLYSTVARVALTAGQAGTDALRTSLEASLGDTATVTESSDTAGS